VISDCPSRAGYVGVDQSAKTIVIDGNFSVEFSTGIRLIPYHSVFRILLLPSAVNFCTLGQLNCVFEFLHKVWTLCAFHIAPNESPPIIIALSLWVFCTRMAVSQEKAFLLEIFPRVWVTRFIGIKYKYLFYVN
jgi:hypothetical protein